MSEIFNLETSFEQMGLGPNLLKGIEACGFKHPTEIQVLMIPPILQGADVLGQAKTGTGKTASFGLPLIQLADPAKPIQSLVLAPTRELAVQIVAEINELGRFTPIRAVAVIGGESSHDQISKLRRGTQIVVGTPGRIMDLNGRGQLSFSGVRWAVLDEVDRMLDIGFREDIRRILGQITQPHQTIFVSATISREVEQLARRFMSPEAQKLATEAKSLTVSQVTQKHLPIQPWDKKRLLVHLLKHEEAALTLIFCRTKRTVDSVARLLRDKGIDAHAIHADLPQTKRRSIMEKMRRGALEVLVASDLASRGLDVDGISHVINYDLPEDPELYVHRIGRTARAGRTGTAWSFVTSAQGQMLTEIEKLINSPIEKMEYGDFRPSPRPTDWKDDRPGGGRPAPQIRSAPPPRSRYEPRWKPQVDPALFPGGVVPQNLPRRTLGSRIATGRTPKLKAKR